MTAYTVQVGEARHSFDLPLGCDAAFPLFTPLGEQRWVEGWNPRILVGDGHSPAAGDVFETEAHGRRTLWMVVEVERHPGRESRVKYVRASDGFQVGEIEVRCSPVPLVGANLPRAAHAESCRVEVRYRLAGLGEDGAALVETFFAPGAFEAFIESWRQHITAALAREDDTGTSSI